MLEEVLETSRTGHELPSTTLSHVLFISQLGPALELDVFLYSRWVRPGLAAGVSVLGSLIGVVGLVGCGQREIFNFQVFSWWLSVGITFVEDGLELSIWAEFVNHVDNCGPLGFTAVRVPHLDYVVPLPHRDGHSANVIPVDDVLWELLTDGRQ